MTKPGLTYVAYDVRRAVTWVVSPPRKPCGNKKVQAPVSAKNPVLKLSIRENVFGSQPATHRERHASACLP